MIGPGSTVDLYYYAESDHVRSVSGTITDANGTWLVIMDTTGTVRAFPVSSIQQMILTDGE